MAAFKIFDVDVNFKGDGYAIEWAKGFVFSEVTARKVGKLPLHSKFICLVEEQGVEVYYDFAACYYFFVDVTDKD
ncbi:hypothetical protein [Vibrio mediterranei]|uniref:hypothetical protein n=1 Tax=Vibrio mediterranei TaxID=689 RepID=UPI004067C480